MAENKKPAIRFKGFTDAWEQRKLGEIAIFINGRAYSQDELLCSGKYKVLRVGNFYTNDSWYYSDMELDDKYYAENGDLLYTWSATFGPHIWRGDKVIYHYHIWKVELSQHLEKRFAVQLLEQDKAAILSDKNGSTMVHITKAGMEEKAVLIPQNNDEQVKIGTFLNNLDNLITLHQRKYDKLVKVKKSMLEKMFPKNGSEVPEIRFKGFTDAWEQREFGSLYQKSSEKNNGSIGIDKNITVATMQFKPDVKVTTEEYLKTYYTFNIGDIAFEGHHSKEFMFGRFVANDIGNGIVSHIFAVFRPYVNYDLKYWKYAIHNEGIMRPILSRCTKASTMMHDLVTDDFLNESILVPSIEEQRKIGAFLDNLDSLITLHQRKLEKLKNIKKSCLEKMFV